MRSVLIFSCILPVLFLLTSFHSRNNVDAIVLSEKPFPEYQLSFLVFDKHKLSKYWETSEMTLGEIRQITTRMLHALKQVHPSHSAGSYFDYYDRYRQALPFDTLLKANLQSDLRLLNQTKKQLAGPAKKDIYFAGQNELYLHFCCQAEFKNDWFFKPEIYFSERFYKEVIPALTPRLLKYENDDNDENEIPYKALPSFSSSKKAFNPEDSGYGQRYIDRQSAQEFLNQLIPTKDKYLLMESALFKKLLKRIISGQIVVVLNKYDSYKL